MSEKDIKPAQHPIIEVLDRVRRIETRLTAGLESLGVKVVTEKPQYDKENNRVVIPSTGVRLKDILALLEESADGVEIEHRGDIIGWLSLAP